MSVTLGAQGVHTSTATGTRSAPCVDGDHGLCSGVVATTYYRRAAYRPTFCRGQATSDVVLRPCACLCGCRGRGDVEGAAATVRARAARLAGT